MTAATAIELISGPQHFFRIEEIERFRDGSGYRGRISVRSGSFALHDFNFYFDGLDEFSSRVRQLYSNLSGTAELRQQWERSHLSISATSRGHIRVAGHFEFFDGGSHRLEFSFESDQSFLPSFIASLERVCRELKTA